jgi:hypothetical protein
VWKYDTAQNLSGFSRDKTALETLCLRLGTPELSKTNLYDAIIFTLEQLHSGSGARRSSNYGWAARIRTPTIHLFSSDFVVLSEPCASFLPSAFQWCLRPICY